MKKLLSILLSILMVLSLVGCGSKQEEEPTAKVEEKTEVVEEIKKEEKVIVDTTVKEEIKEELPPQEKTDDVTQMLFWVVFYDGENNELQRTAEKYGTTPKFTGNLPKGFKCWDSALEPITTNTYIHAIGKKIEGGNSSAPVQKIEPDIVTVSGYQLLPDGKWVAIEGGNLLANTDVPYVAYVQNGQPGEIVRLTNDQNQLVNGTYLDGAVVVNNNKITYDRSNKNTGREIIIKTNSRNTDIEINSVLDSIMHFGLVGAVNVIACAQHSFVEYGAGAIIEVHTGNIHIDAASDIKAIHLSAKNNVFDDITITVDDGAQLPEIKVTRDSIQIGAEGVKVCTVKYQSSSEEIWLKNDGTLENIEVNGEKVEAGTAPTKNIAQQIANEYKVDANNLPVVDAKGNKEVIDKGVDAYEAKANAQIKANADGWDGTPDISWYKEEETSFTITTAEQLKGFADLVNGGTTFEGKTIKLGRDIDLNPTCPYSKNEFPDNEAEGFHIWKAIGVDTHGNVATIPFKGTFDGGNHTIIGMYQDCYAGNDGNPYGLFGCVQDATIKNLTMINTAIRTETENMYAGHGAGSFVGVAFGNSKFENLTLKDSYLCGYISNIGGIVGGCTQGQFVFDGIKVDETNTITTWYGAADTQMGSIIGAVDIGIDSTTTVTIKNAEISCHVMALNDSAGNYQWFQYRSAGMLIGTFMNNNNGDGLWNNGDNVEDEILQQHLSFENVKVYYDSWADQTYCEFHELGHGSYSQEDEWKTIIIYPTDDTTYVRNIDGVDYTVVVGDISTHVHFADESCGMTMSFDQLIGGCGGGGQSLVHRKFDGVTIINNR